MYFPMRPKMKLSLHSKKLARALHSAKRWLGMSSKERRASRRFLIRIPLTVRWANEHVIGEANTESREVSSRGVYFHLPKDLQRDLPVEIIMTLPHELTQAGPVWVRCQGRVLRSSPENAGEVGVAVAMEGYQFMRTASGAEPDLPQHGSRMGF